MEKLTCRFSIPDQKGALVELLNSLPKGLSIGDMQYGYSQPGNQSPVISLIVSEEKRNGLLESLEERFPELEVLTENIKGEYRMIEFSRELLNIPVFLEVEFPERAGALKAFMEQISKYANLFYFNYQYSGERVGHALVGVSFESEDHQREARNLIQELTPRVVRSVKPLEKIR